MVSLLNGLRQPTSGTLLFEGVDPMSLGAEAWTRRVATAPQFHENHVFTEVFAFNLLMGRRWPPAAGDWEEAEAVCEELGLGPLLGKMPGGMNQLIGDTGWQLFSSSTRSSSAFLTESSAAKVSPIGNLKKRLVNLRFRQANRDADLERTQPAAFRYSDDVC